MLKKDVFTQYNDRDIDRLINYILFLIRSNKNLKYLAQKWDNLPSNQKQEVELKLKCMIECILTNSPPYIDYGDLEFVNLSDIPNLCYYIKIAIQNIFMTDDNSEITLANRIHNVVSWTSGAHQQQSRCNPAVRQITEKKQKSFFKWK